MDEKAFNECLDELMLAIEDAIEEAELTIDFETSAGILTLTCDDHSKVILSRQTALCQLWLAAKSGGYHFDFDKASQEWICKGTGENIQESLNRCLSEQMGATISLTLM